MGRSDHSDGQVEFADFFEFLCQNGGKGVEDVGEVFHSFAVQETLVGFVVEQFFYGIVLAEGIHREEDVVAGHVRCHGIRPMEHTHFYENKLFAIADVEAVAGFDDVEIPAPFAVLAFNAADSVGRAINRRIRNFFHERRQGAGMVAFAVVGNDVVDLVQIDFLFQVFDKVETMGNPDRIDEDRLFFFNQIGVLAGAVVNRIIIAVEAFQFPIDIANPADITFYMFSHNTCLFEIPIVILIV